jgi:polysaccharide biosynthesis protein PelF
MLDAMAAQVPRGRFVRRSGGRFVVHEFGQATVADAVAAVNLLEHLLRPLFAAPPEADLCHACANGLAVLQAMAAKWTRGTPLVLTEHGLYLRERYIAYGPDSMPQPQRAFMLSFFKCLTSAAYQFAEVIAPGSDYNRLWQEANGAHSAKIQPIHNGVDALSFSPSLVDPVVPTIAWVGRIDPLKDVKTLLRAFARVRCALPDARLRIFGGTPAGNEEYYRQCLELHDRLGLGTSAVFEGRVPSIIDAYHSGHLVLSTSISEGFPYAVLEAMASGRAVIATEVGGVREAIGEMGILVPPLDHERIADACVELLSDAARRARLAWLGRERVLWMFTLERCLARYRDVYESLDPSVTDTTIVRAEAGLGAELVATGCGRNE